MGGRLVFSHHNLRGGAVLKLHHAGLNAVVLPHVKKSSPTEALNGGEIMKPELVQHQPRQPHAVAMNDDDDAILRKIQAAFKRGARRH